MSHLQRLIERKREMLDYGFEDFGELARIEAQIEQCRRHKEKEKRAERRFSDYDFDGDSESYTRKRNEKRNRKHQR